MTIPSPKKSLRILFLTGGSGAGKTTLVDALGKALPADSVVCLHFDSIGVPSEADMIKQYGSGREWQRVMTYRWVERLVNDYADKDFVIFEGQVDLQFIMDAFKQAGFDRYQIVLVHCNDAIRHQRLHSDRKQPELINAAMDNWAAYLKKQAGELHIPIFESSSKNLYEAVAWLIKNYMS